MTEQTQERIVRTPVPEAGYGKEALRILEGSLTFPDIDDSNNKNAKRIVIFAHGSGSSHHSLRNQFVAQSLSKGGLATLLVDLLRKEEEKTDIKNTKITG